MPEDLRPATPVQARMRFRDTASTLARTALAEVDNARGMPMFDRARWDELHNCLADQFTDAMCRAHQASLLADTGERGRLLARDAVTRFAEAPRGGEAKAA